MFLKSLTMKGFKSFADSTTLELEPGVTVVVGPNGSGKSNVVDAIAWVLGHPAVSVALVGMRNERELKENVAAADWRLGDDIRSQIDVVFADEGVPTYVGSPQALIPPGMKKS